MTRKRITLGFTKSNELFVGRMAMLGVAAALIGEIITGQGPLAQVGSAAAALECCRLWPTQFAGQPRRSAALAGLICPLPTVPDALTFLLPCSWAMSCTRACLRWRWRSWRSLPCECKSRRVMLHCRGASASAEL